MNEKPFFFTSGNNQLFGVLHEPSVKSQKTAYVFCSPFAEEKLWSQRVFVNFARKLASLGYTILRFDYSGHGDSDGNFADSTVETRINDTMAAVSVLRQKNLGIEKLVLLGLRFGATLASLVAERTNDVHELILWEPVLKGDRYLKSLFRINIATQSAVYKEVKYNSEALVVQLQQGKPVSVEGYDLMLPLYEEMMGVDLTALEKTFVGNVLIVHISKHKKSSGKKQGNEKLGYSDGSVLMAVEQPFWKEIKEYYYTAEDLFQQTLQWIEENR